MSDNHEHQIFNFSDEDIDLSGVVTMRDTIRDFKVGESGDTINLSELLEGLDGDVSAEQLTDFLTITETGRTTTISIDSDGDGQGADQEIVLTNLNLSNEFGSDPVDIIQGLLDSGNLVVDQS